MKIHRARLDDLHDLLELGSLMLAESVTPFPPIEPEKFRQYLVVSEQHPGTILVALARMGDGRPAGFLTAVAGDYAWSTAKRAVADLLFVHPTFRATPAARLLLACFEMWARQVGARVAIVGTTTGIEVERVGRYLQICGFPMIGSVHRKELT